MGQNAYCPFLSCTDVTFGDVGSWWYVWNGRDSQYSLTLKIVAYNGTARLQLSRYNRFHICYVVKFYTGQLSQDTIRKVRPTFSEQCGD